MATSLHTFIDIFDKPAQDDEEKKSLNKIVIPIIQRDYAQGRKDPEIQRVRARFLESLYNAITEKPITLDFVYGDVDKDGVMTPLDGQQRLTTLFLLHWYAAKKEGIKEKEYYFLKRFSYETRYSARDFCDYLINFQPSFSEGISISSEIINQSWFPLDWKKDSTIASMLVMLDAINDVFSEVDGIWESLKNGAISFYFLPIEDMGLTDEIYIKMNSRGKPLTQFEHFKAELERNLKTIDRTATARIIRKIDVDWTDMLWEYHSSDNIIDEEFLRYFRYICDVICYHNGDSPLGKTNDEFSLLKEYFSKETKNVSDNIVLLEDYFDCWANLIKKESPSDFIRRFVSYDHEPGKIKIETRYEIDIFEDCLKSYSDVSGRRRAFPLHRIVLLYAFTSFLLNRNTITDSDFARRLRIVNNLIQNSEDEISDSVSRASGNRMPAILAQVDSIVINGKIDETLDNNFNPHQIKEEIEKLKWTENNPKDIEKLFKFEDHPLLQGQISILGLTNVHLFGKFEDLFNCDWDKVDCALMATGFYPQKELNGWRHQFGSSNTKVVSSWRSLFHVSRNEGFNNTSSILITLLSNNKNISNDSLDKIAEDYINDCEKKQEYNFRYYYIKYKEFRPSSYGKYWNDNYISHPYLYSAMQTEKHVSENTYMPYLKVVDDAHVSHDERGQKLRYEDKYIECTNNGFCVRSSVDNQLLDSILINQNDNGIDTENRIEVLNKYLKSTAIH